MRAGKLANFTWITPVCDDSDHVNCPGGYGPSWVAALVNTVGQSKFWNSTAIFIQWDDWGGLYDHVAPPYLDRDGLGFRVPLVMLSPYIKRGHISKVQYETASVLRFAEDLWGLPQMAPADRRAASPAKDNFDFTQKPLPFKKIAAPLPPNSSCISCLTTTSRRTSSSAAAGSPVVVLGLPNVGIFFPRGMEICLSSFRLGLPVPALAGPVRKTRSLQNPQARGKSAPRRALFQICKTLSCGTRTTTSR